MLPSIVGPVTGVQNEPDTFVDQSSKLLFIGRRRAGLAPIIRIVTLLNRPAGGQLLGHAVQATTRINPTTDGDERGAPQAHTPIFFNRPFEAYGLGRDGARLLGSADRPAADGKLRAVIDRVVVDRVVLVLLAANLAEIPGVEPVFARIPVVEAAIGLGHVCIVKVAGVEGVVEGGGRNAIQHHVAHGQHVRIAHQQDVADAPVTPGVVQIALQALGIVGAVRFFQH
jgi:hypothetical protein